MAFEPNKVFETAELFNNLCTRYTFQASDLEKEWTRNGRSLTRTESRWIKQLYKFAKMYKAQSESAQKFVDSI